MSHLAFVIDRLPELWSRTGEHLLLTGMSTGLALLLGIPLGVLAHFTPRLRGGLLGVLGVLQTVPSLAMLAILLALLGKIGVVPAVVALTLYALLPIARNTVTGLDGISPGVIEAARGVGMTRTQRLLWVSLPLALPVIVAGVRTAAVIGVGIATLSAFIGAGGLGQFINRGLALEHTGLILLGAIPAALLALLVDFSVWAAEWGLRPVPSRHRGAALAAWRRAAVATPMLLVALGVAARVVHLDGTDRQTAPAASTTVRASGTVRVGSKEFAEQLLLAELMAQLIEAHTDLDVERRFGLGGTKICHSALVQGEIDLYAEYTGTAYQILGYTARPPGPYRVYATVSDDYRERWNLAWLEPFGFSNTYALTVRRGDAEQHGWRRIADLAAQADTLRAGFTSEFQERPDGYPGLQKAYGIRFGSAVDLSPSLMCEALNRGEVDVICAFATDGRIPVYDLFVLQDDRGFFPPYDAAPVVRGRTLKRYPPLKDVLSLLAGQLDQATMQQLNYEVEGNKRAPATVAAEFLLERGLLP